MYLVSILYGFIISYEKLIYFGLPIPYIIGVKHIIASLIIFIYCYNYKCFLNIRTIFAFLLLLFYCCYQLLISDINTASFIISFFFTFFPIIAIILGNSLIVKGKVIKKQIFYLVIISILLAIPAAIQGILGYDLRLHTGLYREAAELGGVMVATILYSTYLYCEKYINRRAYLLLLLIPTYIILLQVLKKNILVALLFILIYFYHERKKIKFNHKVYGLSLLITCLVFLAPNLRENISDNMDYFGNVGVAGHIRLAMYYTAFLINLDTLGFGSGIGTFGSLGSLIGEFSLQNGLIYKISDTYHEYGLTGIAGNSAEKLNSGNAGTLLDTFWPHIFAELGFFFAIIYIYIIYRFLSFKQNNYIISFIVIALYLDGFVIILPEAPTFIIYSLFFPGALLASDKNSYNNHNSG